MTEAAPAIDRVFEALCFYNSTGPPCRQVEIVKFCVFFPVLHYFFSGNILMIAETIKNPQNIPNQNEFLSKVLRWTSIGCSTISVTLCSGKE